MRTILALAVVTTIAVAGAGDVASAASTSDTPEGQVLVLHTHTLAFAQLDTGQPGESPGDSTFRKDDLLDLHGAHVGTMNSTCVTGVPADTTVEVDMQCTGVLTLDGAGQIDWQGVLHLVAPPPPPPPPAGHAPTSPAPTTPTALTTADPFLPPLAVVGGTGTYRSARGEISQSRYQNVDRTLRIRLS